MDWGRPLETCQIAGDPRGAAPGAGGFASSSFDACLGHVDGAGELARFRLLFRSSMILIA